MALIVWIAALSCSLRAASFDCAKAVASIEKSICSDQELAILDDNLSSLYGFVLKESDESLANAIRKEQRLWLKQDRDICQNKTCISNAYRHRIEYLGNIESVRRNDSLQEKNLVPGRFPNDRVEFLRMLKLEAEEREDYTCGHEYLAKALNDSSPDVRAYAAYGLRGSEYVEH